MAIDIPQHVLDENTRTHEALLEGLKELATGADFHGRPSLRDLLFAAVFEELLMRTRRTELTVLELADYMSEECDD